MVPISRRSLLRLGALVGVGLAGCTTLPGDRATDLLTESFEPAETVTVQNDNGDVAVEPAEGDGVEVEVLKSTRFGRDRLQRVSLGASRSGGRLAFTIERTGDEAQLPRVAVDLTVRLPAGTRLAGVETANGDVEVTGVAGDAVLTTANGDVEVLDVAGVLELRTSNGDIEARGIDGLVGASSANGNVEVDLAGMTDDVDLSSANGDVEVAVAPDIDADIDASTGNGTVDVEGLTIAVESRARGVLRGRLGDGGPTLRLRSGNGDIELTALA